MADGVRSPGLTAHADDEGELAHADRRRQQAYLRRLLASPEVREALWLASPDLYDSLPQWEKEPESEKGKRLERALYRYLSRMASRCTPFGLFSGNSTAAVGGRTRLEIAPREDYRRHSRLDMEYLCSLTERLVENTAIAKGLRFTPNTSLYTINGRFHYVKSHSDGDMRTYTLIAVDGTSYLQDVLARASGGATIHELVAGLQCFDGEIEPDEAEEFISELILAQILQSDLVPPVTGPEAIHDVISRLSPTHEAGLVTGALRDVRDRLEMLDRQGTGNDPSAYQAIADLLKGLPAEFKTNRLIQVDMDKPAPKATLGEHVISEIVKGVSLLHGMAISDPDPPLKQFREAFIARYDEQEIPLAEALDEEAGVGFMKSSSPGASACPLLEGILLPPGGTSTGTRWFFRDEYLLRKLEGVFRSRSIVLMLGDDDINRLKNPDPDPLPDAFAAMVSIGASSQQDLDNGRYKIFFRGAHGPAGANLLGRFCHGDPKLLGLVNELLHLEERLRPDAIFAEIVHLPQGRIGNVICRPVLREHEIPFLGRGGARHENQIPITDLLVSVRGNRVLLRSRRLGKEVIPRLTNAHGYFTGKNIGVYRFLGSLQGQGCAASIGWNWGVLGSTSFLPRVECGRLVLSRAQWHVSKEEMKSLSKEKGDELIIAIDRWRRERLIPRFSLLVDSDNELLIDFHNLLSVDTFIDYVKNRPAFMLAEMMPGESELCAYGPEGHFTHELIVPFIRDIVEKSESKKAIEPQPDKVQRVFPPGSEWLYAKLYIGAAAADRVLVDVIGPLAREAMAERLIDRWFFIRYGDPEWHLRLRFHGDANTLHGSVLPMLSQSLRGWAGADCIWNIQYDTYKREVERYGGPQGIQLAEKFFHYDSEFAVSALGAVIGAQGADARWRLALAAVDLLLSDLGMDDCGMRDLMEKSWGAYSKEFKVQKATKEQLSEKYRKNRKEIAQLLDPPERRKHEFASLFALLERRSMSWAPAIRELLECSKSGRLALPLQDIALSLIHMQVNRLLRSAHRAQEMVLYYMLFHHYRSKVARQGSRKETGQGTGGYYG